MSTAFTRRDFLAASAAAAAGLATRPGFAQTADPTDLTIAEGAARSFAAATSRRWSWSRPTWRASGVWTTGSTPS